jgi:5-methylcytosine-specific restriction endonuclease McrA
MSRFIPERVKKQLLYNQEYVCNLCPVMLPPTYQIDHKIPYCISRDNELSNLQALCPNCHAFKTQNEEYPRHRRQFRYKRRFRRRNY